jgi:hypothetical protein
MKNTAMAGLLIGIAISLSASAGEPQHVKVQGTKDKPQALTIRSGRDMIAEVKVTKEASVHLEADKIDYSQRPGSGPRVISCDGAAKMKLMIEGKAL